MAFKINLLNINDYEKSVKDFLENLEKETSITFDWANLNPTEKFVQQNNQPVELDTICINDGKLIMMVFACGCKTCKEILGLHIFYGLSESPLRDVENVVNQIKIVSPKTPVKVYNLFDLKSII